MAKYLKEYHVMTEKLVKLRITGDPASAVNANKQVAESLQKLGQAEKSYNQKSDALAKQQIKILKGIASISQTTSNAQQKDLKAIAGQFGELSRAVKSSVDVQQKQMKTMAAEFSAVTGVVKSQAKIQEQQLKLIEKGFASLKNEAEKSGDSTKKSAKGIGDQLESIRNKAAISFAAISGSIAMVTKTFGDFEAQLNTFEGISGATREQMKGISDLSLQIGSNTKFSASEVAAASTEVARMGFTYDQITQAMDGFVTTAIASNVTIEQSAELVGKTIRGFKLQASEAGAVGDILTAAMNKSALSFEDLNLSMKYIGPAAASTNQSLETMTGILGLMADQGIKGEQAGTSMRSMLLRLVNPTDDVSKLLKKLGIDIKDSTGNMKPLDDIINQVRESSEKYEPTVRAQIAATVFGTEAYSAAAAVLGTTKEKTDDYINSVKNVNGISEKQAKIMEQGVKNSMIQLTSAVESASIEWGKEFAPAVSKGIDALKAAADAAGSIPDPMKDAGVQLTLFVGGFTGLAAAVTTLTLIKKGIDAVTLSAIAGSPKLAAWMAILTQSQFITGGSAVLASGATGAAIAAVPAVIAGGALNLWMNAEADALDKETELMSSLGDEQEKYSTALREATEKLRNKVVPSLDTIETAMLGLRLNKRTDSTAYKALEIVQKELKKPTAPKDPKAPTGTNNGSDLFGAADAVKGPSDKIKSLISTAKSERDRMAAELLNSAIKNAGGALEEVKHQDNAPVMDTYRMRGKHPITGKPRMHYGTDYGAQMGAPIPAVTSGIVSHVGFDPKGWGKYIVVDHGNGQYSLHAHASEIYKRVGESVKKGDKLAAVGSTGGSTGAHEHYEVRKGAPNLRGAAAISGTTPVKDQTIRVGLDKEQAKISAEQKANNAQILKLKQAIGALDKKSLTYAEDKKALDDAIYEITTDNTKKSTDALEQRMKLEDEQRKERERVEKERLKGVQEYADKVKAAFGDFSKENAKFAQESAMALMSPIEKQEYLFAEEIKSKQEQLEALRRNTYTQKDVQKLKITDDERKKLLAEIEKLNLTEAERSVLLKEIEKSEAQILQRKKDQAEVISVMRKDDDIATTELRLAVQKEKERTEEMQRQEHIVGAIAQTEADITKEKERQREALQSMLSGFNSIASAAAIMQDMMAGASTEAANLAGNIANFFGSSAIAMGSAPELKGMSKTTEADHLGIISAGIAGARNFQSAIDSLMNSIPGFTDANTLAKEYMNSPDVNNMSFDEFKQQKEALKEFSNSLPEFAKELEKIVASLPKPDSAEYKSYQSGLQNKADRQGTVDSFLSMYAGSNSAFAEKIRPIIESASSEWESIITEVRTAFAGRPIEEQAAEMYKRLSERRKDMDEAVHQARVAFLISEQDQKLADDKALYEYQKQQEEKLAQQREKNLNEVGKKREKIYKNQVKVHQTEIDNFQGEIDVLETRKRSLREDIESLNREEKLALSKFDEKDKSQFNAMVAGANVSARVQQALDEYINMQQLPMDRTSLRTQREALDQLLALDEQRNETAYLLEEKTKDDYVSTQKDLLAQRAQFIQLQMRDESLSTKERVDLNKQYADLYVKYKELETNAIVDKYNAEREKVNESIDLLDREQTAVQDRISAEQESIDALTETYQADMDMIKDAVDSVREALYRWIPSIDAVRENLQGAMADANKAAQEFVKTMSSAELAQMRARASNDYGRASAGNVPVSPVRTGEYTVQGSNGWYVSSSDLNTAEGNFFNGGIVPDGHPGDTYRANLRSKEMVLPPNIASHITRTMNHSVRKESNLNLTVYARTKHDAEIIAQVVDSKLKQYDKGNSSLNGSYYSPLY